MVTLNDQQRNQIIILAESKVGIINTGYDCAIFVKNIYDQVGVSTSFLDYPVIPKDAIFSDLYLGYPYFLRWLMSKRKNEVTHFGIISSPGYLIHCSQRMESDFVYKIYKSHFEELFKVYEFI